MDHQCGCQTECGHDGGSHRGELARGNLPRGGQFLCPWTKGLLGCKAQRTFDCHEGSGPRALDSESCIKIGIQCPFTSIPSCQLSTNSFPLQLGSRMPTRYMPAGEIATQRNLLVHPHFTQLHPGLSEILRCALAGGWKLYEAFWQMGVSKFVPSCPRESLRARRITALFFIDTSIMFAKEDEKDWRERMAKSRTRSNFIALVPTSMLKSKGFEKLNAFDSRGFLKWKIMARVKSWCRASS